MSLYNINSSISTQKSCEARSQCLCWFLWILPKSQNIKCTQKSCEKKLMYPKRLFKCTQKGCEVTLSTICPHDYQHSYQQLYQHSVDKNQIIHRIIHIFIHIFSTSSRFFCSNICEKNIQAGIFLFLAK